MSGKYIKIFFRNKARILSEYVIGNVGEILLKEDR